MKMPAVIEDEERVQTPIREALQLCDIVPTDGYKPPIVDPGAADNTDLGN